MKIPDYFYFFGSFLPSWIRIQQLKLMRIHADPDPDPKLWQQVNVIFFEKIFMIDFN